MFNLRAWGRCFQKANEAESEVIRAATTTTTIMTHLQQQSDNNRDNNNNEDPLKFWHSFQQQKNALHTVIKEQDHAPSSIDATVQQIQQLQQYLNQSIYFLPAYDIRKAQEVYLNSNPVGATKKRR